MKYRVLTFSALVVMGCTDGPVPVATELRLPTDIRVDGETLYVVSLWDGLFSFSHGERTLLFGGTGQVIEELEHYNSSLLLATRSEILSLPSSGAAPAEMFAFRDWWEGPIHDVAADQDGVYIAADGSGLIKVNGQGEETVLVEDALAFIVLADDQNIYWRDWG